MLLDVIAVPRPTQRAAAYYIAVLDPKCFFGSIFFDSSKLFPETAPRLLFEEKKMQSKIVKKCCKQFFHPNFSFFRTDLKRGLKQ